MLCAFLGCHVPATYLSTKAHIAELKIPHTAGKTCSMSATPTCSLPISALGQANMKQRCSLLGLGAKHFQTHSHPSQDTTRLTTRAVMVLMVISVRCGFWLLEQPSSSQLIHHPELRFLLDLLAFITGYECQRLS